MAHFRNMTLARSLHQHHPKGKLPVAPPDVPTHNLCPICRRYQDCERHGVSLSHWVYCPFSRCPWRGDRQDNLRNWKTAHANCGQVPKQEHCKIYDPGLLARSVACGKLSIESATYPVLLEVERRAQELGKVSIWADWWGRPQKGFRTLRFGVPRACVFQFPSSSLILPPFSHPVTTFMRFDWEAPRSGDILGCY